ncbi:MerR family transcriptional regulator [Syntrophomonas erecta]
MQERFYKIGEVSEMLGIEQYTLRYLENSLKLVIQRDERGDRQYTESDLDTLRLILQLKEKGLNTTAIRMALENIQEKDPEVNTEALDKNVPIGPVVNFEFVEAVSLVRQVAEQNEELLRQNQRLEQRLQKLEEKLERWVANRDQRLDDLIELWREEKSERNKSWIARLRGR